MIQKIAEDVICLYGDLAKHSIFIHSFGPDEDTPNPYLSMLESILDLVVIKIVHSKLVDVIEKKLPEFDFLMKSDKFIKHSIMVFKYPDFALFVRESFEDSWEYAMNHGFRQNLLTFVLEVITEIEIWTKTESKVFGSFFTDFEKMAEESSSYDDFVNRIKKYSSSSAHMSA